MSPPNNAINTDGHEQCSSVALLMAAGYGRRWADAAMRTPLLFVLMLMAAQVVSADAECTDRPECWPDTSGMYHALKKREVLDAATEKLNAKIEALLEDVERMDKLEKFFAFDAERLVLEIKASQEAWVRYSQARCAIEGMAGQAGSAWQNARAHECEIGLTETRIGEIEEIGRQIREGAGEE